MHGTNKLNNSLSKLSPKVRDYPSKKEEVAVSD